MNPVKITHLEMRSPSELKAKPSAEPSFRITKSLLPRWQINKFFYDYVGAKWGWTDKRDWSDEKWRSYAEREALHVYIAYLHETPVGYFELEVRLGEVEIVMFGLEPRSTGKGLGGHFLSEAIRCAWSFAPTRVVVNTCTLDHPHALANYLARGMTIFKEEEKGHNKAIELTPANVTVPANAGTAPLTSMAHLRRYT